MSYDSITTFASKRNHVCLVQDSAQRSVVVKDFGPSTDCYSMELKVSRILYERGVSVPEILELSGSRIVYTYAEGLLAVELLEQMELCGDSSDIPSAFDEICVWLKDCYRVLSEAFGCEMILGDAHLRNFICGDRVYGVDFECVAPGRRETDIASLAVFAVTYSPICTSVKYRLAAFLCRRCIQLMELDTTLLCHEMTAQLDIISARRRITLPADIVPELWRRIAQE